MAITDKGCTMDSMHWQIYPGVGFLGPASVIHWRVMRTCISPINISTFASVVTRHESTLSLISLLRLNSLRVSSGQTLLLILCCRNQVKMAVIHQISLFFWMCANSHYPWGLTHVLSLEIHPWEYSRKVQSSEPYQRNI